MNIKGKKIAFLGDSITEGHGVSSVENRFTDLIAKNEGAIIYNYGIGGTRIAYQKEPSAEPVWDKCFIGRADEMEPDVDVVFVFGGTNDFGHGDAPIGNIENRDPYTFYGALHTLYTNLITKYPKSKIVIATPLPRCDDERIAIINGEEKHLKLIEYVNIIREMAEYYSLPVLDLYKNSGLQPKVPVIRDMYVPDGLHPNDAGHVILADKITAFFKNEFN